MIFFFPLKTLFEVYFKQFTLSGAFLNDWIMFNWSDGTSTAEDSF